MLSWSVSTIRSERRDEPPYNSNRKNELTIIYVTSQSPCWGESTFLQFYSRTMHTSVTMLMRWGLQPSLWKVKAIFHAFCSHLLHQLLQERRVACHNCISLLIQHPLHGLAIINSPCINFSMISVSNTQRLKIQLVVQLIPLSDFKKETLPVHDLHELLMDQRMVHTSNLSPFNPY